MKALLLAAGVGSRLRPLTNYLPKCLVPIRGKPLLGIWLEMLCTSGYDEIVINTHYKSELVEGYVRASPWSDRVKLVHENALLGTAGTLLSQRANFENGHPFLVAHADNLTRFNPAEYERAHTDRPAGVIMTMMTFRTLTPETCGIVQTAANNIVIEFKEKPKNPVGNLANAAVYIFDPQIFKIIDEIQGSKFDISTDVIPGIVGKIIAFENTNYHRDIGNLKSWRDANREFEVNSQTEKNLFWNELLEKNKNEIGNQVKQLLM